MRIGCVGNTNNMLFSLCRHLRDRALDAWLVLLNNELMQFHPSWDTFDLSYQGFTRTVAWGDLPAYALTSAARIRADLADFDFIIGTNTAPAYVAKAKLRCDIFFPHGSDIYRLPFETEKLRLDQRL